MRGRMHPGGFTASTDTAGGDGPPGGGGGSSFWVTGATGTSRTEDATGPPGVVISWFAPTTTVPDPASGTAGTPIPAVTISVTPTTKGTLTTAASVTASNISPADSDDSATATVTVHGT